LVDDRAEIFWRRAFDGNYPAIWMLEGQLFGVKTEARDQGPFVLAGGGAVIAFVMAQKDADRLAWTRRVVERVDRQRQADGFQMNANLVGFSGLGETANYCESSEPTFKFPKRFGRPAASGDRHAVPAGGVRRQRGINFSLSFLRPGGDDRQVLFFYEIVLKLMGDMTLGADILGHQEHAAGAFVQTVNDS
jgi:hypothetical protein